MAERAQFRETGVNPNKVDRRHGKVTKSFDVEPPQQGNAEQPSLQ